MTTVISEQNPVVDLPAISANGRARAKALRAIRELATTPTSAVAYRSAGAIVIIGPGPEAIAAARRLQSRLDCTVVIHRRGGKPGRRPADDTPFPVVQEQVLQVTGHLGQFAVVVSAPAPQGGVNLLQKLKRPYTHFDLVLDLCDPPFLRAGLLPFGYYAPGDDADRLAQALDELPAMVGEFEKPRFFKYNADICAHGESGLTGCTRCIDACPANAIISIRDEVAVDPFLCQGAGLCATVCPTGAMTYVYPSLTDQLSRLSALLKAYRTAKGEHPVLLLHDAESGRERLASLAGDMPEHVLPFELAELGNLGMEAWLSALAYGAGRVLLLPTRDTPASVVGAITEQLQYSGAILAGMGYSATAIELLPPEDKALLASLAGEPSGLSIAPASFAGVDEKRTMLRLAIEHLHAQAPAPQPVVSLPAGAPFGEIAVNRETCTLCMACVSVCPASALSDGADLPQLNFIEANCVQCGLCATACPEHAISLSPRFLYDSDERRTTRVLNEEAPFHCVVCGKPFATQRMMERMTQKLHGHWMYDSDDALRRIQMCADCRVRDVFATDPHRRGSVL